MSSSKQRIHVQGDRFMKGDEPFVSLGFNYWHSASPGSDPVGGDWSVLCRYDAALIEREVAAMAAIGANTLRIWFAYTGEHWVVGQGLSADARRNLAHFLDTCARYAIHVIVTVGGSGSCWGVGRGIENVFTRRPAQLYAGGKLEDDFLADVLTLIEQGELAERANVLAVDLANEPIFGIPSATCAGVAAVWKLLDTDFNGSLRAEPVAAAWKTWSRQESGEELPIPLERDFLLPGHRERIASMYQRFVYSCFNRHCRRFADALHARWPEMLVTLGLGCGGTGADFAGGAAHEAIQILMLTQNVREMQDGLDFLCIHVYDGITTERLRFLRQFLGSDKPVVIEEFGHIPQTVDPVTERESDADMTIQSALWEVVLDGCRRFNYAGALGCNYCDTGNEEPARNVWSRMGIVDRQGAPKPAQACFVRHARSAEPPADFHPTPIPYDPSHYRHAVQAIGERFAASR